MAMLCHHDQHQHNDDADDDAVDDTRKCTLVDKQELKDEERKKYIATWR